MAGADPKDVKDGCLGALLGLLFMPVVLVSRAYALVTLWGWFVVPLGLQALSLWHAAGLLGLAGFVSFRLHDAKAANERPEGVTHTAHALVSGLAHLFVVACALGFGWLFARLMPVG